MIRKFAFKTTLKNRTKSICAIAAMLLTTIMFCTLYTTIVGLHSAQQYSNLKSIGTIGQVVLKDCDKKEENALWMMKKNDKVESIGYRKYFADVTNEGLKNSVEFSYEDLTYSEHCFQQLISGHMPKATNEIIMDKETMEALGVEPKVGQAVVLQLKIGKRQLEEKFTLAGWFNENDTSEIKTGQIITSEAYEKQWDKTYTKDGVYGETTIDILFKSSRNIEKQVKQLLSEAGIKEEVDYSINPCYVENGFFSDLSNIFFTAVSATMIIIIGFLIIHNIFYLATIKETKEYGRLKALGMEKKQIGKFVKWQAIYLLLVSIPIGIICGYFIGIKLMPMLLLQTNLKGVEDTSLLHLEDFLFVLILSTIFVVFTTIISIYGPLKKMKSLSPIQSQKVELTLKSNFKTTSDGNKLYKFAYCNVRRNTKSVLLVVTSITLTITLIGISYSLIKSFDMDKYLSKKVYSDYKVASENFFTSNYLSVDGTTADLPEKIINKIKEENIVKKDGIVYGSCNDSSISISGCQYKREDYFLNFYGIDKFNLREEMFVEDDVDLNSFYDGDGILEGVWLNEDGTILQTEEVHEIGEKLTIQGDSGKKKTYQVVGHVKMGEAIASSGIYGDNNTFELYVSSDSYKKLVEEPKIMVYSFDVKKGEKSHAADVMKRLIENFSGIDYRSKQSYATEFGMLKKVVGLISIMLCIVFSMIALVNLINVFLTSIAMRKSEFVTLRSIGMTRKQMRKVLLYEILYYTSGAICTAFLLSLVLSLKLIKNICNSMEFLSYSFQWDVYIWIFCVIFVIDSIVVCAVEKYMNRHAIANQLKN